MINRTAIRSFSAKWHKVLGWWGAFAVIVWAISGIAHPLMSWFGPKAAAFYPPKMTYTAEQLSSISGITGTQNLRKAQVIKVVPFADKPLLQVTEQDGKQRRYFSLNTQQELPNHDQAQAQWLASYYTGRPIDEIESLEKLTEFSTDYPSVNRLLPVYKVQFAGEDELSAFVFTETNSLASLVNGRRAIFASVFQALHTWSWLDVAGAGRVLIIACFMLTLGAMAATGLSLVLLLPNRKIPDTSRRLHRVFGYILWLPLLGWSASGFYHLLQSHFVDTSFGIRLAPPANLVELNISNELENVVGNNDISAISLVSGPQETFYFRLSVLPKTDGMMLSDEQRFAGRPTEASAMYIYADSGRVSTLTDAEFSRYWALQFSGLDESLMTNQRLVTHFGPGYDFRNKRLPVWQFDFNDENGQRMFIDPVTGMLVDQNRTINRAESWSFSILHKWNMLTPLVGRQIRDVMIVAVLLLCIVSSAVFGGIVLWNNRKLKKRILKQAKQSSVNSNRLTQHSNSPKHQC
ncbi:hypothetical protein [Aurantivibrio plasticivorans]